MKVAFITVQDSNFSALIKVLCILLIHAALLCPPVRLSFAVLNMVKVLQ